MTNLKIFKNNSINYKKESFSLKKLIQNNIFLNMKIKKKEKFKFYKFSKFYLKIKNKNTKYELKLKFDEKIINLLNKKEINILKEIIEEKLFTDKEFLNCFDIINYEIDWKIFFWTFVEYFINIINKLNLYNDNELIKLFTILINIWKDYWLNIDINEKIWINIKYKNKNYNFYEFIDKFKRYNFKEENFFIFEQNFLNVININDDNKNLYLNENFLIEKIEEVEEYFFEEILLISYNEFIENFIKELNRIFEFKNYLELSLNF